MLWCLASALAFLAAPVGAYLVQWPAATAATVWLRIAWRPRRSGLALVVPAAVAASLLTPQLLLA